MFWAKNKVKEIDNINQNKTNFGRVNKRHYTLKQILVIFKNLWMLLVLPQISRRLL